MEILIVFLLFGVYKNSYICLLIIVEVVRINRNNFGLCFNCCRNKLNLFYFLNNNKVKNK